MKEENDKNFKLKIESYVEKMPIYTRRIKFEWKEIWYKNLTCVYGK